jgi:hypothetical protein
MPTFFRYLYIFLNFFFTINRRKKWESGQKSPKPLIYKGFRLPTFTFKSGQKVGKWPQIFDFLQVNQKKSKTKVGRDHFLSAKVGSIFTPPILFV